MCGMMEIKGIQLKEDKIVEFEPGFFVRLKKNGKVEMLVSVRRAG